MLTVTKKIDIFAKKPIKGGIPATENNTNINENASAGFVLFNKIKSDNSLLCFNSKFCLFSHNIKIINQMDKLEIM